MKREIEKAVDKAPIQISEWFAAGYIAIRDRTGLDGRRHIVLSRDARSGGE